MNEQGSASVFAVSLMSVLTLATVCIASGARLLVAQSHLQTRIDNLAIQAAQRALWGEPACQLILESCNDDGRSVVIEGAQDLMMMGMAVHIYARSEQGYGPRTVQSE